MTIGLKILFLTAVLLGLQQPLLYAEPVPLAEWYLNAENYADDLFTPASGTVNLYGKKFKFDNNGTALFQDKESLLFAKDFTLPEKSITVEAWVQVNKPERWGGLVGAVLDNGSKEQGWILGYIHDRFCFAVSGDDNPKLNYKVGGPAFMRGNWYHVVGTYDGVYQSLYVNGKLQASHKHAGGKILYPSGKELSVGAYIDTNEHYPLNGKVGRVAVYDSCLSKEQVLTRFNQRCSEYSIAEYQSSIQSGQTKQAWWLKPQNYADNVLKAVEGEGRLSGENLSFDKGAAVFGQQSPLLDIDGFSYPDTDITVEARVKVTGETPWSGIVSCAVDNGRIEQGWMLGTKDKHFILGISGVATGKLIYMAAKPAFELERWYHLVGTYDGRVQKLYVDGKLAAEKMTDAKSIIYGSGCRSVVGGVYVGDEREMFNGQISYISISDTVLNDAAVLKLYKDGRRNFNVKSREKGAD